MTFATTTDLMPHQGDAVAKLLPSRVGALFMDMGTGKSRTIIELARVRAAKWDRFVWFCPVSLKSTVLYEILKHTNLSEADVYVFDGSTTDTDLPLGRRFYVVGIESMQSSDRVVLAVNKLITDRSFVIVDESSYIKGAKAARTQRITGLAQRAKYRAVLTGTPFSQGVVDLYAQMKFLSPKILGYQSFWAFANNHLEFEVIRPPYAHKSHGGRLKPNGKPYRPGVITDRIVHSHNADQLAAKMAPYVYQVRKDECLSLPDKLRESMTCRMTPEQRTAYDEAKAEFLANATPDNWNGVWIFKLFTALQTIVCGYWNSKNPETGEYRMQTFPHERLDLMSSAVAEIPDGERTIIWAKYRFAAAQVMERLSEDYGPEQVCRFDGGLSEQERGAELARWRAKGRFIVATQACGGHGLTLNEAAYTVFYADGFKYSERLQAEDRNHRIGQTRRPVYVTLRCADSIDDKIALALHDKGNALRSFQAEVNLVRRTGTKEAVLKLLKKL